MAKGFHHNPDRLRAGKSDRANPEIGHAVHASPVRLRLGGNNFICALIAGEKCCRCVLRQTCFGGDIGKHFRAGEIAACNEIGLEQPFNESI